MCGISGMLGYGCSVDLIRKIVVDQKDRGPDFCSVEQVSERVVFGHNRLAILDLTVAGNQPFWDVSKKYCLSYNGEIYNYLEIRKELESLGIKFVTNGDTEVLIESWKMWGVKALDKFNGMFAFSIYEKEKNRVFLVRDRFGVKPLYYFSNNQNIVFASTANVIAREYDLMPNFHYIAKGTRFWAFEDDTSLTQYEGIKLVEPGYYIEIKNLNSMCLEIKKPCKYYDIFEESERNFSAIHEMSYEKIAELVYLYLDRAVNIRLRSDVQIGISLSGGLDSSSISFLAAEKYPKIIGFTFGDLRNEKSEAFLVLELARKLNIHIEYVGVQEKKVNWRSIINAVVKAQDAPFSGISIIAQYFLYEKIKNHNIKVVLGGQGGDELFMGYRKYQLAYLRELISKKKYVESIFFGFSLMEGILSELPRFSMYARAFKRYEKMEEASVLNIEEYALDIFLNEGGLKNKQVLDIKKTSLPTLLRYEDRNSMAHGIESRLPYMDYKLVELALAIPVAMKLRKGYGKWIIRDIMKNKITESIRLARYKRGFDISENWISSGLGDAIRNIIMENRLVCRDVFNEDVKTVFSDEMLKKSRTRFVEAMSLIWISGKLGDI